MVRDYHEVRLGHYSPLFDYLMEHNEEDSIALTFEEIETILGRPLPPSARTHGLGWWTTNPTATQARSWLAASRHPRPTGDGRVEFIAASTISWNGAFNNLRITRMAVEYARDRLSDSVSLDKWMREITDGWWEPHAVYVIHYGEANVTKVGLTNINSSRLRMLTQIGGDLIDTFQVPNRWVARVLEGECLTLADDFRVEPPLWIAQVAGATEFWRDGFELPSLQQVFETTCGAETGDSWKTSIARPAATANRH